MEVKSFCIQKLRLYYFELNLLNVGCNVIHNIVKTYPTDEMLVSLVSNFSYLNSGKNLYSELDRQIPTLKEQYNEDEKKLLEIDKTLSENLKKLASIRIKTFNLLINYVFDKDKEVKFAFSDLQKRIATIYEFFDKFINNSSIDIPSKLIGRFLTDIDKITSMININGYVTINLARNSKTIFEKLKLIWLLKQWYIKLNNFKQESPLQLVNQLMCNLSDAKYTFLLSLMNMKNNINSKIIFEFINSINAQDNILSEKEIIELLDNNIIQLRISICDAEIAVSNTIKSNNYSQKCINLFKQTFYFKLAKNYMNASNEFTLEKCANIPILNSQLNQSFIDFFSLLLAGSMIGIELYNKSWFGLPYNLMGAMADILLNFNMMSKVYVSLKSDELKVTQHMKYLKQIVQFALSFMLFGLSSGLVSSSIFKFVGGYFSAVMMQFLFSNAFNNFQMNHNSSQHTLSFLSYILQIIGLIAGTFLWQQVLKTSKYFTDTPNTENILSNQKQCLAHPKICHEEALKVLELENKHVDSNIINQQYRTLAKQYHPDKANLLHNSNNFFKITEARDRLRQLNTQSPPTSSIAYQTPTKQKN